MVNVFIIHGAYGSPEENWFPWIKKELERLGNKVFVPRLPTPKNQSLESWSGSFKDFEKFIDDDSIFVGHSLGPAFILSLLEKHSVKAAFLVSPFVSLLGNPNFDKINRTFYRDPDWTKIKENCKDFHLYHSDNDPYVPLSKAEDVAGNLGVKIKVIKGAGHFNERSGYKKFPILLEDIKIILQNSKGFKG